MITIVTDNHKKLSLFIKKQKRYLNYRYFTIAIYYQLESAEKVNFLMNNKSFIMMNVTELYFIKKTQAPTGR